MPSCMCGSTDCPSCGPAQGSYKCSSCGSTEEEGCPDPEACAKAERLAMDSMADFFQWERDHVSEIAEAIRAR